MNACEESKKYRAHSKGKPDVSARSITNVRFAIAMPVAIKIKHAPVDMFAEIAPALDVAPDIRGEITGGMGIRHWF